MSEVIRPKLWRWRSGPLPGRETPAWVFVHGMASDGRSCFSQMLTNLARLSPAPAAEFYLFDYDYNQTFEQSGNDLARELQRLSKLSDSIDLIGHSMGGLVARTAIMLDDLPFVRRIITLATPNHGTLNGDQLSFGAQLMASWTRKINPVYERSPGVFDLTQAHKIMRAHAEKMVKPNRKRLDGKSYISIPGQYYHTKRDISDKSPSWKMGGVTLGIAALNVIARHSFLRLAPVHDGIVEERSNRLNPAPVGCGTNELSFLPSRVDLATRVLHVTHDAAADLDHVEVTTDERIAELIAALLVSPTLRQDDIDKRLGYPLLVHYNPPVI